MTGYVTSNILVFSVSRQANASQNIQIKIPRGKVNVSNCKGQMCGEVEKRGEKEILVTLKLHNSTYSSPDVQYVYENIEPLNPVRRWADLWIQEAYNNYWVYSTKNSYRPIYQFMRLDSWFINS